MSDLEPASRSRRLILLGLIAVSFAAFLLLLVLRVGVALTSPETTDSAGRTMGFNDRFSAEHYSILVRNFSLGALFQREWFYEWILAGMHLVGLILLLSGFGYGRRFTRVFFFAQAVIFPFGWIGFPFLPGFLANLAALKLDRESFIDVPFLWLTAQPIWIALAVTIAFLMPGEPIRKPRPQLTLKPLTPS